MLQTMESNWKHWQQYIDENPWVLVNISQGEVIDWSSYGSPQGLYCHLELIKQWANSNKTMEVISAFRDSFEWHEVGMSSPLLQFCNSTQIYLWKLASAFHPLKAWNKKSNFNNDKFHLSFNLDQIHTFVACVQFPYLLLEGPVQCHPSNDSKL